MDLCDLSPWIIHRYSRADALADGELVDVTDTAHEAGLRWPVAVTAALWREITTIPAAASWQDVPGRLWDVIWMARYAIGRASGSVLLYQLYLATEDNTTAEWELESTLLTLKIVAGPGDEGEPVLTIMLPTES